MVPARIYVEIFYLSFRATIWWFKIHSSHLQDSQVFCYFAFFVVNDCIDDAIYHGHQKQRIRLFLTNSDYENSQINLLRSLQDIVIRYHLKTYTYIRIYGNRNKFHHLAILL